MWGIFGGWTAGVFGGFSSQWQTSLKVLQLELYSLSYHLFPFVKSIVFALIIAHHNRLSRILYEGRGLRSWKAVLPPLFGTVLLLLL